MPESTPETTSAPPSSDMPSISDMVNLNGRVALVTGGGRGFGYACVRRLSEAGAAVMIADYNEVETERLDTARTGGRSIGFCQTDISDESAARRAVDATVKEFGRLDILVNNAGVFSNFLLENLEESEFRRILDVNVLGTHNMTRAAVGPMRSQGGGGSIINISSIDSLRPSAPGLLHYDASKHAVLGMTKSAAIELGPDGIRVNAIAPGSAFTEGVGIFLEGAAPAGFDVNAQFDAVAARTPLQRVCKPDDVARVALFLASDLASFLNGEQIVLDGGFLQT